MSMMASSEYDGSRHHTVPRVHCASRMSRSAAGAHGGPMGAPMGPRAQNRDFYLFFLSKRAGRHPRGTGGAVGVTCEDIAANGCLRVRFRPTRIFSGTFQRPFLAGKRPGGSQHTREPP